MTYVYNICFSDGAIVLDVLEGCVTSNNFAQLTCIRIFKCLLTESAKQARKDALFGGRLM